MYENLSMMTPKATDSDSHCSTHDSVSKLRYMIETMKDEAIMTKKYSIYNVLEHIFQFHPIFIVQTLPPQPPTHLLVLIS